MAKMIPHQPTADTKSTAEKRLFKALAEQLPASYTVFQAVAWQLRHKKQGMMDGETDFLIGHPDFGLLILEVKGGHIRYDPDQDQWYSNERPIKDPFHQGRNNKYSLLSKLKEHPDWREQWVVIGYSAAFPDVAVKGDLRLDAPRALVLDAGDMQDLAAWVARAFHALQAEGGNSVSEGKGVHLGRAGVQRLTRILSPALNLPPLLSAAIDEETEALARLTEDQFRVMQLLGRQRRAAVAGCAGSGKTMLAYKKAQQLAEAGFTVLLTCYNRALAQWLRVDSEECRPSNLHIQTFHSLATDLVEQGGLPRDKQPDQAYYDHILPERLLEASRRLGSQFDAIIVDEGQDFHENWWTPLQCLLHDPNEGMLFIFYDDNQDMYHRLSLPITTPPFPLPENCRNTQHIHHKILQFYRSDYAPTTRAPEGRPIAYISYTSEGDFKTQLRRLIHQLVVKEGVSVWDIVILTPIRKNSHLRQFRDLGNFCLTDKQTYLDGEIFWTTIHSFKGLESPVIILVELDQVRPEHKNTMLYVGCSRARNHLILLTPEG